MLFNRFDPANIIRPFIECYWTIDDEDATPVKQKIIPDGFPEIIFHYGDPYKILINSNWELQNNFLLAGQITRFFWLENTGTKGVFGIKFKPAALYAMFRFNMKEYNNKVASISDTDAQGLKRLRQILSENNNHESRIAHLNSFFEELIISKKLSTGSIDDAIELINKKKGMIAVSQLSKTGFLSERQLLNRFRQQVGLSPKLYTRIIRLNYIFKLVKERKGKWGSLAYEAAYFDQAHFIKDFKEFTGENPGRYAFDEKNLANFFLMS